MQVILFIYLFIPIVLNLFTLEFYFMIGNFTV